MNTSVAGRWASCVLLLGASAAWAVQVQGAPPARGSGRAASASSTTSSTGSASAVAPAARELVLATVSSVDRAASTFTVSGRVVPWRAGKLKVIEAGSGRVLGEDALQAGRRIRFAWPEEGSASRSVELMYLER